jgi:hypothetical protein
MDIVYKIVASARLLIAMAAALALSACQHTQVVQRPPEILAVGVAPEQARAQLATFYLGKGYAVNRSDNLVVTFDKQTDNVGVQLLYTCGSCQAPRSRLSFTLIASGKDTKVVAGHVWVANENTMAHRQIDGMTPEIRAAIEAELAQIFKKA